MRIIFFFIFIYNICFSQNILSIDKISPKINITNWIDNVPMNKELHNKYIVLEFWATWCTPCLKSVPHLNELQGKYKREDLYFISITDEETYKVKKLLKLIPFNSIVVTDTTKSTQKNFGDNKGLKELPLTVLIDNQNIIKWIGKPNELNEDIINNFLSNKITIKEKINYNNLNYTSNLNTFLEISKDKEILNYLKINVSLDKYISENNYKVNKNLFFLKSVSFKEVLINVLDYNENLISFDFDINKEKYDILYKNSFKETNSFEITLLNYLNINKVKNKRKTKSNRVYVLQEKLEKNLKEKSSIIYHDSKVMLLSYNFNMLCEFLNKNSNLLFHYNDIDDSKYNFELDIKNTDSIIKSLELNGLKLKDEVIENDFFTFNKNKI